MKKKICSILFLLFFLSSHQAFSQVLFDGNGLNLTLDNGHLIISTSEKEIVNVSSINFNFTSPKSISKLLIKSEIKPSSVSLDGSKIKFNWNKDTGIIETELNKETQANIKVLY